jgi:alpha-L-rhamnosidase
MYRVSAGIDLIKPGYKEILIQPHPAKKLEYSKASLESPYGMIASGWERKDGKIIITIKIPANTKARILLPADDISKVTSTAFPSDADKKASLIIKETSEGKRTEFVTGSGEYVFEIFE